MLTRLILLISLIPVSGFAQEAEVLIREIMANQEKCWNSGNIDCFMVGYWESDSLMFVSSSKVYYGFQETLARYKKVYPSKADMGLLTFSYISMEPLGENAFYVVGSYHLKREIGDKQGHFTLLWRKIDGEWVIVSDHSS